MPRRTIDMAAYSCILHVTKEMWDTHTKSMKPMNKMSPEEAEWWGRYAYQLASQRIKLHGSTYGCNGSNSLQRKVGTARFDRKGS